MQDIQHMDRLTDYIMGHFAVDIVYAFIIISHCYWHDYKMVYL